MKYMIRKANLEDLPQAMQCIKDAKTLLKQSGSKQWNGNNGYPDSSDLTEDIKCSRLYLCEIDSDVAGIAAFLGEEPEYQNPYGKWLLDTTNYMTIHRIAVRALYRGMGIAKALFIYAEDYASRHGYESIRVDTHEKNKIMQAIAVKMGYVPCGYVLYKSISSAEEPKRLIYEKRIQK